MQTLENRIANKFVELTTGIRMLKGINETAYQDLVLHLKEYLTLRNFLRGIVDRFSHLF